MTRNQLAARYVTSQARDADDARLLLDALGLLTSDGIPADDNRTYPLGDPARGLCGPEKP